MEKLCTQCGLPGKFVTKKAKKFSKKLQGMKIYQRINNKCNKCVYKRKKELDLIIN
jgi:hypothetical protein